MRDEDWVRAIRHGVGHDGRSLFLMPSVVFQNLSAADVGAIIAYVKSVPPVDRELPPLSLGPVARGLIATDKVPFFSAALIDHSQARARRRAGRRVRRPSSGTTSCTPRGAPSATARRSRAARSTTGDPSWPPAANLTPTGLKAYDEAAFFTALRTGVRPGGAKINDAMPWRWTREMTDDEIRAVWLYLKTVPPREFGAR